MAGKSRDDTTRQTPPAAKQAAKLYSRYVTPQRLPILLEPDRIISKAHATSPVSGNCRMHLAESSGRLMVHRVDVFVRSGMDVSVYRMLHPFLRSWQLLTSAMLELFYRNEGGQSWIVQTCF